MMRNLVALTTTIAILASPTFVHAKGGCPADARAASKAVFPPGTLRTGREVTGTHPCGRQITCVGGIPGDLSSRQCHWE